ncbi:uncharacterized protein LOC129961089 [Argiope bruennichi]|uniref:uncharacterized protein LOC129961089 n=1 Tax=Argiope bruennichi TaxID=94029 RepID=UPI002494ABF4|nr:uncharacterized protein LOC129960893 isoform X1 [Argiope bruennichi]XP_055930886.1 uncharacterized protein LOC129961089 [Argiope bruennichi]
MNIRIKNNLLFFTEMKYVQKPRLNSMLVIRCFYSTLFECYILILSWMARSPEWWPMWELLTVLIFCTVSCCVIDHMMISQLNWQMRVRRADGQTCCSHSFTFLYLFMLVQ